jgi:small nuclear ribonucleoprotein (snRNP)-like protein
MQFLSCGKYFPVLLLISVLLPTAWADQVVLKNGDRLTGSIIKKDEKNLMIKTDHLGVISIPWDQVDKLVAEKPIHIVFRDGKTLQGILAGADGDMLVTTSQTKINTKQAEIAALRNEDEEKAYQRLLHPGWGQLWAGAGTIGLAGTAGNARTLTFTTGISADRVTNTDKTSLYFSLIKASARINNESKNTAEAVRGGISYGHNVNSRLFASAFNDYEYDRFQNLDLRFVIGGGFGFHAWKRERSRMDLLAGAAYNRSSFSTPLLRESAELYWGNEYSLKLSSATSLIQSYRMFNDITHTGMYRVNVDIGLSTRLLKWLSWNVSLSDRYLSDPAPFRKKNDFLYTTGLGITFAK